MSKPAKYMEGADIAAMAPHIDRVASFLWPVLRSSVTPIVGIIGKQMFQWGTGTLFQIADAHFLVSATHVWTYAKRDGADLALFDLSGPQNEKQDLQTVPLVGVLHSAKDPFDIGVFELDAEAVSKMPNRKFLRLNQTSLHPVPNVGLWIYGFPAEACKYEPSADTFGIGELLILAPSIVDAPPLAEFDPSYHFLVDVNRAGLCCPDGTRGYMPNHLNGISGGSIWQTVLNPNVEMGADNPRILSVGVQTSHYEPSSIIQATPWAAVANILWQRKPDLRRLIEMHLGPAR
jgi:hypothetical protein